MNAYFNKSIPLHTDHGIATRNLLDFSATLNIWIVREIIITNNAITKTITKILHLVL